VNGLAQWARKWAISSEALLDLRSHLAPAESIVLRPGGSEAAVQARIRLRASQLGRRLWRNNVGAVEMPDGGFLRYGLANESKRMNEVIKSGDLIGINPRIIQPEDVGSLIGQFVSIECKEAGWRGPRPGNTREQAQLAWAALVQSLGGDARMISSEGQL